MLRVDNVYGAWPLSGEIDIMEARGNAPSYPKQSINYVRSLLKWGPTTFLNAVAKTYGWITRRLGRHNARMRCGGTRSLPRCTSTRDWTIYTRRS
ncbi:hypothetical protein K438DRAFT_2063547 [Mycena galopus ATCC 62051]|nr:hypothetical protein K438DRAFT_2063547 [Mycena galopus ATCC 62051]